MMSTEKLQRAGNQSRRTAGERLFEEYLRSQGIEDFEYEKEHSGKLKKPDYTVMLDREYLFDVKDFTYVDVGSGGFYDPYRRLRTKIGELRGQFREYKDWPCCGVLYNNTAHLVDLSTPMIVHGAMYGDLGVTMRIDTVRGGVVEGSEREEFLSGGKMLMRSMKKKTAEVRNSTISALITLRPIRTGYARLCNDLRVQKQSQYGFDLGKWVGSDRDFDTEEEHLGVIVWENVFARIPLPRQMFSGAYDERYGLNDESRLTRVFAGEGVLEYENLMGETQSPLFARAARNK
jgi:hypothetical protein